MPKPLKIMVWGPGKMGGIAILEALEKPGFELVGVGAYSPDKDGVDVGTLLGLPEVGLTATTDRPSLLSVETDCVIYTAHDRGTFHTDDEILELLAAGHNVITPLPYQNAHLFREPEFVEKLEAACKAGQSVFHASGIDPDTISDRVVMSLTGLCTDIESIAVEEYWDCSASKPIGLQLVGFGDDPEEAKTKTLPAQIAANFLRAIGATAEKMLGQKFDELRLVHDYVPAPHDLDTGLPVKKGQVGRVAHRVEGYIASKGPEPFYSLEYNWVMGKDMLPEGIKPGQFYQISIEGRPSLSVGIDIKTSLKNNERFYETGTLKSEPNYYATIAPCLLAIKLVTEAEPGILPTFGPGLHWSHTYGQLD